MKKSLLFLVLTLFALNLLGQVKIGSNPNIIDDSSLLELESSNRVLVLTRVTDTQMNAITPLTGGMVFNTDQSLSLIHISEPTRPY